MIKPLKLSTIILFCMLLCACSSNTENAKDAILREYAAVSEYSINADIKADLGSSVFEYGVKYTGSAEKGTLTVLSPDSIAGIKVQTDSRSGETKLLYDGAQLYMGDLDDCGLDPVSALPLMAEHWRGGYVTECSIEPLGSAEYIALTYMISDGVTLKTLFDSDTHLPYTAEIVSNGKTVIFCSFKDVTIN